MTVNAPALDAAADKETDGVVTLTITPPAAGDYDHCEIRYKAPADTAWSDGGNYTGSQGTQGTVDVESLTNGVRYLFIVWAVDGSDNAGPPSIPLGATPSDGTSTNMAERVVAYVKAVVETITEANGYWDDIEAVYRFGEFPQTDDDSFPIAFLHYSPIEPSHEFLAGATNATAEEMTLTVIGKAKRPVSSDSDWVPKEALRMLGAITDAVLEDRTFGGLVANCSPGTGFPNIEAEKDEGFALVAKRFRVQYRHQFANSNAQVPS